MKKILFIATFIMILMNIQAKQPFAVDISFDAFYTNLSPYGEWIEIDRDVVVWRPLYVESNWQPYSNGRWIYTDNGWYWDSYEQFGWATAHYGRWLFDDYYGWIWFPNYEWGPAWVEWRYGNSNIGWAPLPPYAKFSRTSGIVFSISWKSNYRHWRFVNYTHFCNHNVAMFYQPVRYNKHIWGKTKYHTKYKYRNNRIYNNGISRDVIERKSRQKVRRMNIEISNTVSQSRTRDNNSNSVVSYRPSSSSSKNSDYKIVKRPNKSKSIQRDKLVVGRNNTDKSSMNRISTNRANKSERRSTVQSSSRNKNTEIRNSSVSRSTSSKKAKVSKSSSRSSNSNNNVKRSSSSSSNRKSIKSRRR